MEKLKLNLTGIGTILSREQMKKITGGEDTSATCVFNGWVAHNANWTQISVCSSREQAQQAMSDYGLSNYCHDSCLESCCEARPTLSGCNVA